MNHDLRRFVCDRFADEAGVPWSEIERQDLSLAAIVSRSATLHNSLDLMESFARTANALKKEHGVRVRLPTFPMDTPASQVIQALVEQLPAAAATAAAAAPTQGAQ